MLANQVLSNDRSTHEGAMSIQEALRFAVLACLSLGIGAACAGPSATDTLPLVAVADVPLGGRTTRMDYASVDADHHRLYIAHLGDSAVIVFDTQANRVEARIGGLADVHGVLAVPELGRVYATATGSNEVVAIDAATRKILARTPTGRYPDGMAYASQARKLYVSDKSGHSVTVVDVDTNRVVATIPLRGEVGNTQYDPVSRHVFSNEQSHRELVEIDPATDAVVARIKLPGAAGNHGLLIDPKRRLAFVACEDNGRLLIVDLSVRRVAATYEVGRDPDVLALDPTQARIYVASEAGVASVFQAQERGVVRLGAGMVGPNAHVVAIDPRTHRVYFPLKNVDGRTVLRILRPR